MALVICLIAAAGFFMVGGVLGSGTIRSWIAPAGPAAPLAFVVVAGVLGAALVPGAVLAATSGLLFGAATGAVASVAAAVVSAALAREVSARSAGAAADEATGRRATALIAFARRNGFAAVVVQRLLPAVPDGPFSHAFGVARVRRRDVVLGTAVASGPRALAYALLGSGADDPTGPHAVAGVALVVLTGFAGLGLGWWVVRRERRRRPAPASG